MSAEVFNLRPYQSARDQARRLGDNALVAVVRRVRQEQREGRSGHAVAGELQRQRLSGGSDTTPPSAA